MQQVLRELEEGLSEFGDCLHLLKTHTQRECVGRRTGNHYSRLVGGNQLQIFSVVATAEKAKVLDHEGTSTLAYHSLRSVVSAAIHRLN